MLLTCVLLRFDYSSYYENIKQYVVFIIKNSDMVSWKWAYVKSEKGTTLGPGCQLGGPWPPRLPPTPFICWPCSDNLIKHTVCFKSVSSPCIDLIITNQKNLSMKSCTLESDLSDYPWMDYHKTIIVILRKTLCKWNPKTIF